MSTYTKTNIGLFYFLGLSLTLFSSHFPLCILQEAVVWRTFNGFCEGYIGPQLEIWYSVCVCVYKCVYFLDSHVEVHITALFNLCYPHSKPIRFYIKSWNWELWGWEHGNQEVAVLQSTPLYSWSLVQQCGFYCSFMYTLWLYVPQATHTCPPSSSDACATLMFHQTSASLSGPPLFVTLTLWMFLTPSVPCLGVALVPLGTNRRLLQCQWPSWLVLFSMRDLASLARMWLGEHNEAVKWRAGAGLCLAIFFVPRSNRSDKTLEILQN